MPAVVTILCGPGGAGKTAHLLERCRERARAAAWLGPTRRAVEALRPALWAGVPLGGPWLGTLQDFADAVVRRGDPDARPLADAQRRLLIEEAVAALHAGRRVRHFARVLE